MGAAASFNNESTEKTAEQFVDYIFMRNTTAIKVENFRTYKKLVDFKPHLGRAEEKPKR